MRWKSNDYKKKSSRKEKSFSILKKRSSNKSNKKLKNNKEPIHNKSPYSKTKSKICKINFPVLPTNTKLNFPQTSNKLKISTRSWLASYKYSKKSITTQSMSLTLLRPKPIRIGLRLLRRLRCSILRSPKRIRNLCRR
jgi:hypothetical protein